MLRKNSIAIKQLDNIIEQKANKGFRLYADSYRTKRRRNARRGKKSRR